MSELSDAKEILQSLLNDDIIRVRPSDRERFMTEWRGAMEVIEKAMGSEIPPVAWQNVDKPWEIIEHEHLNPDFKFMYRPLYDCPQDSRQGFLDDEAFNIACMFSAYAEAPLIDKGATADQCDEWFQILKRAMLPTGQNKPEPPK